MPEFKSIADMKAYLIEQSGGTSAAEPIQLKLSGVDLSSASARTELFAAVGEVGKYVAFDLSACTGPTVWERYKDKGTDKIVSLTLPDMVAEIAMSAFAATFASLKKLSAKDVETVGDYTFDGCTTLTEVNLPRARSIGELAFSHCYALIKVNLPRATSIGDLAFAGCIALAETDLPQVMSVGEGAFGSCIALAKADLPQVTSIGDFAFSGCRKLESLVLRRTEVLALGGHEVFHEVGWDTERGFTIFVPDKAAKTRLEAEITSLFNDWRDNEPPTAVSGYYVCGDGSRAKLRGAEIHPSDVLNALSRASHTKFKGVEVLPQ